MIEDILLLLVVFLAGVYLGWKALEKTLLTMVVEDPAKFDELMRTVKSRIELTESISIVDSKGNTITTTGIELEVEVVNGFFYAYARETNQFIAQGPTLEELLETAHKRFPGKTFFGNIPEGNQNS